MARISLDPPRTLSYRIGLWFLRRRFGEVLEPFRCEIPQLKGPRLTGSST